jgi:hypothetical protein
MKNKQKEWHPATKTFTYFIELSYHITLDSVMRNGRF